MSAVEYKYELNKSQLNFSKKLMCIEYPGIVNNVDKMIQTLGGINNIGVVYSAKNRRVELRFRPDDVYCKPTCGDRHTTTSLLLKIKVKKERHNNDINLPSTSKIDNNVKETVTFETSVVGIVDCIYKFNNLCDFQYLALDAKKDDSSVCKLENIYDKLKPNFVPTMQWINDNNVSLFLPPPLFSRFDTVHYYNSQKIKDTNVDSRIIGRTRKKRKGFAIFISPKEEIVPKKPKPDSLKLLHVKFLQGGPYEKIKKLFEDRPIWSKNALIYATKYTKEQLKYLLPTVAYYFVTGPWRVMWVRYGYDPRKDPNSRIYQTFDYRLRTSGGLKNRIKAKRSYSNCMLPYKNTPASRPKVPIITRYTMARVYHNAKEIANEQMYDENLYIFRPGFIPPFRQMFYQYCDVHIPEIHSMINKMPLPDPEVTKCDLRTGWFPADFDSKCREIISNLVTAEIKRQMHDQQKKKRKQSQLLEESNESLTNDDEDNNGDETRGDDDVDDDDVDDEINAKMSANDDDDDDENMSQLNLSQDGDNTDFLDREKELNKKIEITDSSSSDSDLDFILDTDAESDIVDYEDI